MKTVLIGCVEFSHTMLSRLLELDAIGVAGVVTRKSSKYNADFRSLAPLAEENGIPIFFTEGNDQDTVAAWVRSIEPDVVFCLGWSYLLGPDILSIPTEGVIGYHPTLLPRNRGHHPIVWALALGLQETGSTFFIMNEGADSGDIISQRRIPISDDDDAASLYAKLQDAAVEQLAEIVESLLLGNLERRPQDPAQATFWRKRGKRDGEIDWRMSTTGVCDLVRALTRPYVGAHCVYAGRESNVWKAVPAPSPRLDVEPGRVLAVNASGITVKTGDGAVTLVEHEFLKMPAVGNCL